MKTFADRLADAVLAKGSCLVVGLDPNLGRMPRAVVEAARGASDDPRAQAAAAIVAYQERVLERVAPFACAVKPQIAYYEEWGPAGFEAYERACDRARELGLLVIGDIKRGDIGSTASAYATAHLPRADAVTVNPYLGTDSLQPFLDRSARTRGGLFVLVRTSNPSAADLQDLRVDDDPVHERVAGLVGRWGADRVGDHGYSDVGAVVGATRPEHLGRMRALLPRAWFLIPGVGAQGGKASDLGAAFDERGLGAVVNSSRGILYAYGDPGAADWEEAVAAAAEQLRDELRAAAQPAAT